MMNIAIGSDHGGFELKELIREKLEKAGHCVENFGCHSRDSVDYPDFAERVCITVKEGSADLGILICGTGIGMSLAANRYPEIRAALCHDEYTARLSKEHNNANILCLGARVVGAGVAEGIVDTWLASSFSGGRHQVRIDKFS
jgi:ribose 5-phosphate isomerase B